MTHSVEKTLKDLGDKVDAAERARVESAISDLRSALKSDDKGVIEKKTDALAQASAAIAQRAYASEQQAGAGAGAGPGAAGETGAGAQGSAAGRDDVVDAEFEEVKDKDRKAS
jgi:molecular chaperone DnaK